MDVEDMGDEPSRAGPAIADVLARAADRIEPEGRWAQGYFALDAAGEMCEADDPRAACWCVLGAIDLASGDDLDLAIDAQEALRARVGTFPQLWNDAFERTQAEVVAELRATAALARDGASLSPSNPSHNPGEEG